LRPVAFKKRGTVSLNPVGKKTLRTFLSPNRTFKIYIATKTRTSCPTTVGDTIITLKPDSRVFASPFVVEVAMVFVGYAVGCAEGLVQASALLDTGLA
jgi:hypothetical protein